MKNKISFRHNIISLNSMESFANIRGGFNGSCRDVYFIRVIGESKNFIESIKLIDKLLKKEANCDRLKYLWINSLPQIKDITDINFYIKSYEGWKCGLGITFNNIIINEALESVLKNAISVILEKFKYTRKSISDSMIRNFIIKMFFWLDSVGKEIFSQWNKHLCIKVITQNIDKEQEYLFYLMLTFLGCDVMLIQNCCDVDISTSQKQYSSEIILGKFGKSPVAIYKKNDLQKKHADVENSCQNNFNDDKDLSKTNLIIPGRTRKYPINQRENITSEIATNSTKVNIKNNNSTKTFEELARLASSVVLIVIHDKNGKAIGTGSGIMIGKNGFILTNNHVAAGGQFYSVRIEDDEEVYTTKEVIKYNPVIDLAVIRIDKQIKPIPIYKGNKKLARGQKVVAIGSPLGLFNSVSDGIISGFRNINDVDMIQFTAPISHGSSGGAVLNMQGEVIGISTAGMDSGQNINLAIGYESIIMFAKGFY